LQTSNLPDEVRLLGGVLIDFNSVLGVCRIRTRAREARRPGSIPGKDTARFDDLGHLERKVPHVSTIRRRTAIFFETMSKRRKGFPSETNVKRGVRIVRGDKLLEEKRGRNDLCPCGSGMRFKKCCLESSCF
jgi:hypothetical protein